MKIIDPSIKIIDPSIKIIEHSRKEIDLLSIAADWPIFAKAWVFIETPRNWL